MCDKWFLAGKSLQFLSAISFDFTFLQCIHVFFWHSTKYSQFLFFQRFVKRQHFCWMKIYGCHFKILIINLIYYLILWHLLLTLKWSIAIFPLLFFFGDEFFYLQICMAFLHSFFLPQFDWTCVWCGMTERFSFSLFHSFQFTSTTTIAFFLRPARIIVSIILFILFQIFLWIFIFNFHIDSKKNGWLRDICIWSTTDTVAKHLYLLAAR